MLYEALKLFLSIINFKSNNNLIIPEYTIELLNKNKKIVKKIEYLEKTDHTSYKKNIGKLKTKKIKKNIFKNRSKNLYKSNKIFRKKFKIPA